MSNLDPDQFFTEQNLAREVDAAFDVFLDAEPEAQAQILADLERTKPDVYQRLRKLIDNLSVDQPMFDKPAIDELAKLRQEISTVDAPRKGTIGTVFGKCFLVVAVCSLLLYIWTCTLFFRFGAEIRVHGWAGSWTGHGIRVTAVDPRGPAAHKLQTDDLIVEITATVTKCSPLSFPFALLRTMESIPFELFVTTTRLISHYRL